MKNTYTLPTQPEDSNTDVLPSRKTAITAANGGKWDATY